MFNNVKLMFFHAPWCGQCKAFAPTVEEVVKETGVEFVDVDLNKAENIDLCNEEGVLNLPVVIITNGEHKERIDGFVSKEKVLDKLNTFK